MHQLINKAAITVIPKEPFIKWVQSTDAEAAEIPDESILSYSRMYLVDDSLDGDDPEKLIKRNFKVIFEEELAGWRGGPLVRTGNSGSLACLFPH